jgi:hypothetical protein
MKIDLGFSLMGGPNTKDSKYINITRVDVLKRVRDHPAIDPWTKEFLVKKINEYPDNALLYFIKNINEIVVTALNERSRVLKEKENDNEEKSAGETVDVIEQQDSSPSTGRISTIKVSEEKDRETFFSKNPVR